MAIDKINHHVNCNRFIGIDQEELTALELIGKVTNKTNEIVEELNVQESNFTGKFAELDKKKTDLYGDHKGTWQGLSKPTLSQEGAFAQVEKNMADIKRAEEIRVNVNSLGLFASETLDQTEKIQSVISNGTKLFFPKGRYIFSKPIMLKSNLDILCDKETIFFLKDMSKCILFDTNKGLSYENITIKGGVWDGNDHGQGPQSTQGLFNFSHAFRFFKVKNLSVTDMLIKDIRGHAIAHWNCNGVIFENIEFRQNVDLDTKPVGGSRRDGITGGSSNMVIRNIRGFTDDDMIALLSGVAWGGVQVQEVENVIIDKISFEDKNFDGGFHHTWCGVRVACSNGYTTRNVKVTNVSGKTANWIVRLGGYDNYNGGYLEDITLENINQYGMYREGMYDEMGAILIEQCSANKIVMNNISVNSQNAYKGTLIFNRNAYVKSLILNDVEYYHKYTGDTPSPSPLIKDYWSISSEKPFIENLQVNNVSYKSNIPMILYKKSKTHSTTIPTTTTISASNIYAHDDVEMIGGELGTIVLNSREIFLAERDMPNQTRGSVHCTPTNMVTQISDTLQHYAFKTVQDKNSYYSFTPKDRVVLITASKTNIYRVQENVNYTFPVGFMIDIKRIDNDDTAQVPYLLMSKENDLVGNTTSNKKQIYIKPKQRITLVHLGNYQWGIVGVQIDQY